MKHILHGLPVLLSAAVFVALLAAWLSFLETDRCLDLGGVMQNGACVDAQYSVVSFWESSWNFKLLVILPPLLITGFLVVIASSLMEAHKRDA